MKAKLPPKKINLQRKSQEKRRAKQQESVIQYQRRQLAKSKGLFATEDTVTVTEAKLSKELDNRSRCETSTGTSLDA